MPSNHQLINASSGDTEIYTPPEITDGWMEVLGEIDLDPASSEMANLRVRAKQIYTEPTHVVDGEITGMMERLVDKVWTLVPVTLPVRRYADWGGLSKPWCGKGVMNPPFGTPQKACQPGCASERCVKRGWHTATDLPGMPHWINHFLGEHKAARLTEGMMICFAATSEGWFRPLLACPQCFLHGRTNYMLPDGTRYKGATKGSCVTYLGPNVKRFAEVFGKLGTVKVAYHP